MRRVVRPGGMIGACVWDADHGMEMLGAFWMLRSNSIQTCTTRSAPSAWVVQGEIAAPSPLAGLTDITETNDRSTQHLSRFRRSLGRVPSGIGPAGAYCTTLPTRQQTLLRDRMYTQAGAPTGTVTLAAVARSVTRYASPSDI